MTTLLLACLLSSAPQVVTLDWRGHAPRTVERVLDDARPAIGACLVAPPPAGKTPVVREPLPSRHLVTLQLSQPGAVAAVGLEGSARLDAACVRHALIRLEFGETTGKAGSTVVKVPLTCDATSCAFPWSQP